MADQKISQLPTITGANMANNDKFVLVDTSGDATVATTRAEFFKSVPEVTFGDGIKAKFGNGSDLQISHDGNNSIIDEVGTGNLFIRATNINFQNRDSNPTEQMITAVANGAVTLNHNGSPKLITSSTGINVTGTALVDGLTVDTSDQVIINHSADGGGIRIDSTNATNTGSLRFGDVADNYIGALEYNHSTNAMTMYVNNAERMRIDSSGRVGIGADSPDSILHLQKTDATAYSSTSTNGQVGVGPTIYLENPANSNGTVGGQIVFGMRSTEEQARIGATGGTAPSLVFGTADAERMRIAAGGNVGIGNAIPSEKLTVSAGVGDGIFLEDDNNSGSSPFIKARGKRSDGNGSQSFGAKLLLDGHRTDAAVASGKKLGTVAFGGNHTNGTDNNILYSASISGVSEGTFSNATTMPTALVFYTGSTGRADNTANVTSGSEAMRIAADGKVGISQPTPAALLHVGDSTNSLGTTSGNSLSNFTLQSDTTNTDLLLFTTRRTADGTSWTSAAHKIQRKVDNVLMGYMEFGHNTSSLITFGEANSEYARIDGTGAFHVGRTTNDFADTGFSTTQAGLTTMCRSDNLVLLLNRHTANNGEIVQFRRNDEKVGSINVADGSTSYLTSSDYRLKENVVGLTGASARVNQLKPSQFNFISDETNTLVDGFLAHEVATIVPEAIAGTKDAMMDEEYEITPAVLDEGGFEVVTEAVMGTRSVPDYQSIDQSKLVPLLTAALQEALAEITSLKTRVEALEG